MGDASEMMLFLILYSPLICIGTSGVGLCIFVKVDVVLLDGTGAFFHDVGAEQFVGFRY